jgi:hypothetical protein
MYASEQESKQASKQITGFPSLQDAQLFQI